MAYDETLTGGTTSKIIEVMVRDSTTGQGKTGLAHTDVTASYVREGGTRTAISLGSGTAGDSYSSGKWCEVDSTNQKGLYQMHLPDAAIASGVAAVTVSLQATGMIDKAIRIKLQAPVNAVQISGDSVAADNLELAYDGTGYDVGGIDVSELNQIVDDLLNGGRLDLLVDAIKAKTDNLAFTTAGKVDARVDYVGTNAVTSPDDFKATGFATPTNVTDAQTAIVTEINANETKIDSIITTIGIAGAGLSAIPWNNAEWDAEVQSEVNDALVALNLDNALIAQGAVRSVSVDSSHRVNSHVYEMQPNTLNASALAADAVAEIQVGLATATKLLNYVRLLARKDSAVATDLATELGEINADTGTGTGAYSNNDALESIRDNASAPTVVEIRQEMDSNSTSLSAIVGYFSGITSLASWLGALAGKTADSSTLTEIQATTAGATYDNASDSLQALRDRGDVAWSGAGGSVNITPLSAGVEQRVNGTNITLYLNEVKATTISITDSAGTAIDLSALTLELAIEDHAGTDIQVIADADITISGDSSNNATFTNTAAVTASERVLHWALRDITTGSEVLARGLINVKRAADGD